MEWKAKEISLCPFTRAVPPTRLSVRGSCPLNLYVAVILRTISSHVESSPHNASVPLQRVALSQRPGILSQKDPIDCICCTIMSGYKRSAAWVDLTGSSPPPQAKHSRVQHPITPPVSSQAAPGSSFDTRDYLGDDVDGSEIVDLSQAIDEGLGWIKIGVIHGKIVGTRYYSGYATQGEQVMIKREPSNPYDSNAIRIDNVQSSQIGHIPRQLASKLAPYLVRHVVSLCCFVG